MGQNVTTELYLRGFLEIAQAGRYRLTARGAAAIALYPESEWKIPDVKPPVRNFSRR